MSIFLTRLPNISQLSGNGLEHSWLTLGEQVRIVQLQGGTAGTAHLRTQESIPEDTGTPAECAQTGKSTAVSLEGAKHSFHSRKADYLTHVHNTKTSASSAQRHTVLPKRHCARLRAGHCVGVQFYRPSGELKGGEG